VEEYSTDVVIGNLKSPAAIPDDIPANTADPPPRRIPDNSIMKKKVGP